MTICLNPMAVCGLLNINNSPGSICGVHVTQSFSVKHFVVCLPQYTAAGCPIWCFQPFLIDQGATFVEPVLIDQDVLFNIDN